MAATEAQIGYGTLLKMGDAASPEVFTTIAEVKEISGFGFSAGLTDATHMESPGGYKEYVASMKDGDTMTIRVNMTADNETILKTIADAGLRKNFKIIKPGSLAERSYSGIPVAWHEQGMTPDGVLEVVLGLKISGAIS